MSTITNSKVIGTFAGLPMHSWDEVAPNGSVRSFEEYVTSFYAPSLERAIGLTLVREISPSTPRI